MLINSDIWTLIEQEVPAFRTLQLYNATVVVHAHDFLSNVIRMSDHPLHYGGDYLLLEEDLAKVLNSFNQCNIRPIFIFGGASTLKSSRLQENMRSLQKRISNLNCGLQQSRTSNQIPKVDHRNGSFYTPVFAKETLVKKLDAMGFLHVTCDADAVSACVALAAHLRRPLVANSNELLLFEFEEPSDSLECFIYIPLRFLSSQPVPQSSNPHSLCLVAHAFSPSNSSIHRIPYVLRPFFAIYFKPPNGSYFPLPHRLYNVLSNRENSHLKDSIRPMVQRAKELVRWLESIESPVNAFCESVEQLEQNAVFSFTKELVEITLTLKIDLMQGEDLARYLLPNVKPSKGNLVTSTDLITCLARQPSCLKYIEQYVNVNEPKSTLQECEMANFLSRVPPRFLQLYRSGFLSTVVFTHLLSSTVVLPVLEENPTRECAAECSRGIRYLQYCLALDFIRRYDAEIAHLSGCTEPTIVEFSRSKDTSHYRQHTIRLKPSPLPTSEDSAKACGSFIYKNIGYQMKSVSNWIEILALTLTLWHINTHPDAKFNILDQTTALAVALIVCAVEASNGSLDFRLLNDLADDMACDYNVDVVHEIIEIQLLHISMLSLLRLANAIGVCEDVNNENPEILLFPRGGRIFPSSRLIHNLAVTLKVSQDRESLSIWLERLLSPIQNAEHVREATESMIYLARTLCEMWIVRPVEFLSHCELLPFPTSGNRSSIRGDHQDKNGLSPSQQVRSFYRGPDLRSGRGGTYVTRSSAQRMAQSRANDKTFTRSMDSREPSDKDTTINGVTTHEKVLLNEEKTHFMQETVNNSYKKWGKNSGFHSRAGPGRPFRPRGPGFGNESECEGRSTNPFLPNYVLTPDFNQRLSSPKIAKSKNPFLSDLNPSCRRAASECRGRQGFGRAPHYSYSGRRESVTLPASEHGLRTFSGKRFQPTISESGNEFTNENSRDTFLKWNDNFSMIGEVPPTSSSGNTGATKTLTRVNSEGDCKDQSQMSGERISRFRGSNLKSGPSGPCVPFNPRYPVTSPRNNWNKSHMGRGKQFGPFNGVPRRGRTFNDGFYVNKTPQGRCSDFNRGMWDPNDIDDAVKKLALDFP
ncbi:hypothetical protein ECG_06776 [Echinococcus granulosus]|uniref:Protein asteroid 1 n=1 Tax=Echinococcus granulosus TaxID=6210 RepID=A0A068WKW9_ECHGR|nr:hypothetical protein ECG_06776 [Echinococcus granulosus]CDS19133.1 hypothetical protein EgrG_000441800 [Echinococcus granulosus]